MNFLEEIENEFSRLRGQPSRLSPMDWNLAADWETKGVPLRIVFSAMADVQKNFESQKRADKINSLTYFKQAVEKQFAEWQTSQVGKSNEVKNDMKDECFTAYASSDNSDVLDYLVERIGRVVHSGNLPEPAKSAAAAIRADLIQLIEEIEPKQLSTDDIETRLREMAMGLTVPMTLAVPEAERLALVEKINQEFSQRKLDDDARAKILTRKLYERFDLPELTLFEI